MDKVKPKRETLRVITDLAESLNMDQRGLIGLLLTARESVQDTTALQGLRLVLTTGDGPMLTQRGRVVARLLQGEKLTRHDMPYARPVKRRRAKPGDPGPVMTEAQAAAHIGWSSANLRSHRERVALAELAQGLKPAQVRAVKQLATMPGASPRCIDGLRLTRPHHLGGRELNARGLEVARVLERGPRPALPPPYVLVDHAVRYRVEDLNDWLDRNPAVANKRRWLTQDQAAMRLGIAASTLKTMRHRSDVAATALEAGGLTQAEEERLRRVAASSPPCHRVGKTIRYEPAELERWIKSHRSPHPLERQPADDRGEAVTPEDAARLMGITVASLVGYRSRAGGALRRIANNLARNGDVSLSKLAPRHVKIDGRVMYYRRDVEDWVEAYRS